jgi:hypothetical protein
MLRQPLRAHGSPEINRHIPHPGDMSSSAFDPHFGETAAPHQPQRTTHDQSEAGSPHPQNSQVIFIEHQPQMAFGVQSIDRQTLKNNVVALAKAAKVFKIRRSQSV